MKSRQCDLRETSNTGVMVIPYCLMFVTFIKTLKGEF